ncbi:MAG TPA: molybdate ABC transporter substrate-binding protein [Bryobacteraceae bacterium]|nr:molybdate ABC transporter substrate-binding protein [Bryobacteraceae bacterium]
MALLLASAACARQAPQRAIDIAAAADLNFAMQDLSREFRAQYPATAVRVAYGSSGNFFAQIRNQAPFDIFLSADVDYPRRLAQEGLALPDSLFTYAVGRIVLWVPGQSPLDLPALKMRALEAASVKHIAVANPEQAPYGRAAVDAMRSLGVYDRVRGKLVEGENIAQTMQFVESGSADIGIVALSLALAPAARRSGRLWEVPLTAYPKIEQGGIILNRARNSEAARSFRQFLLGPAGARILKEYGFYMEGH